MSIINVCFRQAEATRINYVIFLLGSAPLLGWSAQSLGSGWASFRDGMNSATIVLKPTIAILVIFVIGAFVTRIRLRSIGLAQWWAVPVTTVSLGLSTVLLIWKYQEFFWTAQAVFWMPQLVLVIGSHQSREMRR